MTYELFLASDTPFSKHLGVGKISQLVYLCSMALDSVSAQLLWIRIVIVHQNPYPNLREDSKRQN